MKKITYLITIFVASLFLALTTHGQVNGDFSISHNNGDFSSWEDAVIQMSVHGVSGTVTFNIEPGDYTEMLFLTEIEGATSSDPVIFRGVSGDAADVIVRGEHDFILELKETKHVFFENITFELNTNYGTAVILKENISDVKFTNCRFVSSSVSVTLMEVEDQEGSLEVTNSYFEGGDNGIRIDGSSGTSESGLLIENNFFKEQGREAIKVSQQKQGVLNNNTIISHTNHENFKAIDIMMCDGMTVTNNRIFSQFGTGISIFSGTSFSGANNEVSNNMISIKGNATSQNTLIGITGLNTSNLNILHNTIHLGSNLGDDTRSLFVGGANSGLMVVNNIFSNLGNGMAVEFDGVTSISLLDYNDYYNPSGILGSWNGQDCFVIGTWASVTGFDQNSISVDPAFELDYDLYPTNPALVGFATLITGQELDINGVPRTINFPGAFEAPTEGELLLGTVKETVFENNSMSFFPNPAKNSISIKVPTEFGSASDMKVFDMQGRLVLSLDQKDVFGSQTQLSFDISSLESGLYIISLFSESARFSQKIRIN